MSCVSPLIHVCLTVSRCQCELPGHRPGHTAAHRGSGGPPGLRGGAPGPRCQPQPLLQPRPVAAAHPRRCTVLTCQVRPTQSSGVELIPAAQSEQMNLLLGGLDRSGQILEEGSSARKTLSMTHTHVHLHAIVFRLFLCLIHYWHLLRSYVCG